MSYESTSEIISLYIHIPFCIKKCPYCNFYSLEGIPSETRTEYISALLKELALYREDLNALRTIYIGGGTPSVLSGEEIERLLTGISKNINNSGIKEFTFEANPATLDREKLSRLKDSGVTRISLGVQSFNEGDLLVLGRLHNVRDSLRAIEDIKKFSFDLSIDLIYGIPGQTLKSWHGNLSRIEEIIPEHISVYELTVEEGTLLEKEVLSGKVKKPPEEETVEIFELTHEFLKEKGYLHYEVSNYAIPGRLCEHNINYWKRGEYLGLGAGAHSFFDKKRIENINDIEKYISSLKEGRLPYKKIIKLSPEDEFFEFIMLGLRMSEGICLDHIPGESQPLRERLLRRALPLIEEGFLEVGDNYLRPTVRGFLLLNEIIEKLLTSYHE